MKEKFSITEFRIKASRWYMNHKGLVFFNIVMLLSCFLFLKHPLYIPMILLFVVVVMFLNGWYKDVVEPSFIMVEE